MHGEGHDTRRAAAGRVARRLARLTLAIAIAIAVPVAATGTGAGGPSTALAESAGTTTVRLDGMSDRLSGSDEHTCTIGDGGEVMCWGAGFLGQLGLGRVTNVLPADLQQDGATVSLPGGRRAVAVSAGARHTCAVLDNGAVACWGFNDAGQLGYGNTAIIGDDETPAQNPVNSGLVPLPVGRSARAVATGFAHTCALLDNGQVACWGDAQFGQLGYGNSNDIGDNETPAQNPVNGGVVPLPVGRTATAISAQASATCAVLDNGQVACWGFNSSGQLGYGNMNSIGDDETPAQNPVNGGIVPLPSGRSVAAIDLGSAFVCAVLDNGAVACWGLNQWGRLGYGNTNNIGDDETPAQNPVDGGLVLMPSGRAAVGISAGSDHACALLDDGQMMCWGKGAGGRLGSNDQLNIGDDEKPNTNPANGGVVQMSAGRRVLAVEAGNLHTCVILDDTTVKCVGRHLNGVSFFTYPVAPVVALPTHRRVVQVASGSFFNCALFEGGSVQCWGHNSHGQLGTGSADYIGDNEKAYAAGAVILPGNRTAISIAAGSTHACAVLENGGVSCWGDGANGQLGYGNTTNIGDNETPAQNPVNGGLVPLPLDRTAVAVTAGQNHTCALLDNGQISCWGDGAWGQLGNGHTIDVGDNETPAQVVWNNGVVGLPAGRTAVSVSAGAQHTCVLLDNAQVACWGLNQWGRLGYGNTNNIGDDEYPSQNPVNGGVVPLPAGRTAISVDAAAEHTCAVLDNGAVSCWGEGSSGQLGLGTTGDLGDALTPATTPLHGGMVPLPAGRTAVRVDAGGASTCAVLDNGQVACWGKGDLGQLGYGDSFIDGTNPNVGDNETPAQNPDNGGVVPLNAGRTARSVTLGHAHTCAVYDDGTVACWGWAFYGQLGHGNKLDIGVLEAWTLPNITTLYDYGIVPLHQPLTQVDSRALQPARLLDTRGNGTTIDGAFQAGGMRAAGSTLVLKVAGRGGAALGATSVTLTVTAVQPAGSGYLTVWPCAQTQPTASSLNYGAGVNTANTVITAASGDVCIFTSKATHLVADVTGYTPRTSRYTPVNPARLLDTRPGSTTFDGLAQAGGLRAAGSTLTLQVTGRGAPVVVPNDNRTVVLNVAAVQPGAAGYLTVFPCDQTMPNASNVNYAIGANTANMVIAQLSFSGSVCIYTSKPTHLIADVVGWFDTTASSVPTAMRTVNPARLVDTRASGATVDNRYENTGPLAANTTYTFQVAGRPPLANAGMAVLNVAVVGPVANGFLTIWPCDQSVPTASSLNFLAGVNRANQVVTALSAAGTVCVRSSQPTQLLIDVSGSMM